jgi:glycosyltransferase 2 family protein
MTDFDWREATDKLPRVGKTAHVVRRNQPISDIPAVQLSAVSQVMLGTQPEVLASPDASRYNGVGLVSRVAGSVIAGSSVVAEAIAGAETADGPSSVRKIPQWVWLVFRCVVTVLLFVFLLKSVSWSEVWSTLLRLHLSITLIGLVVGLYGVTISAYQWQCFLRGERIHIDLTRLTNLYLVGIAFNHFLPTNMGGDVIKIYYVAREGKNMAGSASAAIMARITGFFGMLLVSYPALLFWKASISSKVFALYLSLSGLVLSGVLATFCLALLFTRLASLPWLVGLTNVLLPGFLRKKLVHSKILSKVIDVGNTLVASLKKPSAMIGSTLFGVMFHLVACINYFCFSMALGMTVPLHFYLVAVPLVSLIAFLPISINGFGLREGALVFVLSTVHVPAATALLLAFAMDMEVLFFGLIGICIYVVMGGQRPKESLQKLSQK